MRGSRESILLVYSLLTYVNLKLTLCLLKLTFLEYKKRTLSESSLVPEYYNFNVFFQSTSCFLAHFKYQSDQLMTTTPTM